MLGIITMTQWTLTRISKNQEVEVQLKQINQKIWARVLFKTIKKVISMILIEIKEVVQRVMLILNFQQELRFSSSEVKWSVTFASTNVEVIFWPLLCKQGVCVRYQYKIRFFIETGQHKVSILLMKNCSHGLIVSIAMIRFHLFTISLNQRLTQSKLQLLVFSVSPLLLVQTKLRNKDLFFYWIKK